MLKTIFLAGLIICTILTTFQLIRKDHWVIRFSDFPHAQLTALTVIFFIGVILTTGLLGPWYIILIKSAGLLIIAYQLVIIFPYTVLASKQAKNTTKKDTPADISILEANVYMDNDQYEKLIRLVTRYQPDILITIETDNKWEKALSVLEADYPYTVKSPFDNTYGMHLYSKLKLHNSSVKYLIEQKVPSIETDLMLRNGKKIRLYVVHPKPPSPTESETSTPRDAELVLIAKKAKDCSMPVIVTGDLNDVAWSHTTRLFQRISKLLDPRIGRGFFNTFHAKYPMLRWPLDHIFLSKEFLVSSIKRLAYTGSDHFPMLISLCYEPAVAQNQNEETAEITSDDIRESSKKVKEASTTD